MVADVYIFCLKDLQLKQIFYYCGIGKKQASILIGERKKTLQHKFFMLLDSQSAKFCFRVSFIS